MKSKIIMFIVLVAIPLIVCSQNSNFGVANSKQLRINDTIIIDGLVRNYLINLPPNYNEAKDIPIVFFFHGAGGSSAQAEKDYGFSEKANAEKFAIVYPNGISSDGFLGLKYWNAGDCCSYSMKHNINDVKFISLLIDKLMLKYPKLSPQKVYLTGISNGAMMCYRLASELSNKITAIAPVAGPMMITENVPQRPVPVLHIHSVNDKKVPYDGGIGLAGFRFSSVDSTLKTWATFNNCSTTIKVITKTSLYTITQWSDCKNNAIVKCIKTKDGGHSWPGGTKSRVLADSPSKAIIANDVIWEFFKLYQLP